MPLGTKSRLLSAAQSRGLANTKLFVALGIVSEAYELGQQLNSRYTVWKTKRERSTKFFVSVMDDSDLFRWSQEWLLGTTDEKDVPRSIIIENNGSYTRKRTGKWYTLMYDNKTNIEFMVGEHAYVAEIKDKESNPEEADGEEPAARRGGGNIVGTGSMLFRKRLTFTCDSREAREHLIEHLDQITQNHMDDAPSIMTAAKWGDWVSLASAPARDIKSVILHGQDREMLIGDIQTFLESEEKYVAIGLPWHRGYLFSGPAGTGKTSLARAVASHFGLPTYYMSLSSLDKDTDLVDLLGRVPPRSVVIFEDIDIVHASRERDADHSVTLGGLLNALDGFVTPHGVIMIMTTNRRDVLDEALTRPGRVDVELDISFVDDDQLERMVQWYTQLSPMLPSLQSDAVTPGMVMDVFKKYLDNPADGLDELVEKIKTRWV